MKPVIERLSDGVVVVTNQDRRTIFESQGRHYFGAVHQRRERYGSRGQIREWHTEEGGGNFFDMTEQVRALLKGN